jgi:hypothetical protein
MAAISVGLIWHLTVFGDWTDGTSLLDLTQSSLATDLTELVGLVF